VTQLRPGYATLEILGGHQRINLVPRHPGQRPVKLRKSMLMLAFMITAEHPHPGHAGVGVDDGITPLRGTTANSKQALDNSLYNKMDKKKPWQLFWL